jgi:hypothetical protein
MSGTHAAAAFNQPSPGTRGTIRTLREALQLCRAIAEECAKRRLLVAFAVVARGALLAAGTPLAPRLVVIDS